MWAIVVGILSLLGRLFASKLGRWIIGALMFLGISFATTRAVKYGLQTALDFGWGGIPADLAQWLSFMNVDACFSVIASGYVAGWAAKAALGGILHLQARAAGASIPTGSWK